MPTRIIREGINDSKAVNRLSDSGEIFYRRLLLVVDDFGRFESDLTLLRAKLFGFKLDEWPEDRIARALADCASRVNGSDEPLILLYTVGKKELLEVSNFGQRHRSSKYAPPEHPQPTNTSNSANGAVHPLSLPIGAKTDPLKSKPEPITEPPAPVSDKVPEHIRVADGQWDNFLSTTVDVELKTENLFGEFWSMFWRGENIKAARSKFNEKVKTAEDWTTIRAAVLMQTPKMLERAEQHRPQAATWLSEERWNDETSPPQIMRAGPKNAEERNQKRRDDLNQGLKVLLKRQS